MADIELRPIARADVRSLSKVLARAFYDDPVMNYMLPDDKARAKALPSMFASLTRNHFIARGGSEVASRGGVIGAATLWDPPGQRKSSRWEELRMMPTLAWHFHSRTEQTKTLGRLMEEAHPEEPHWYLMVIGSDPSVRGAGFGQALMHQPVWTAATPSTHPRIWRPAKLRWCPTTCGLASSRSARSTFPTVRR